jgi:MFS family permease
MNAFIHRLLLATFFASGCAALIYQLVWQRYLFTGLGVDIDSVTLIVSSFMLGIGMGGALGGWVADSIPEKRLKVYAIAEFSLALIGFTSPWLFSIIQSLSGGGWTYVEVSFVAVLTVLIPTTIMGMTLPLLTVYFNDTLQNIGASTGTLYLFNTLGAAFGAWIAAEWLFSAWGLDQSAWLAAVLNLGCGTVVVLASRAQKYFGKTVSILKDS